MVIASSIAELTAAAISPNFGSIRRSRAALSAFFWTYRFSNSVRPLWIAMSANAVLHRFLIGRGLRALAEHGPGVVIALRLVLASAKLVRPSMRDISSFRRSSAASPSACPDTRSRSGGRVPVGVPGDALRLQSMFLMVGVASLLWLVP